MAITWTDFQSGDLLSTIRGKINGFNNTVVTDVNQNTTDIATNTASIATNTTNIAALAAEAGVNEDRIDTLEGFHTFDYAAGQTITVPSTTYSSVLSLTTPSRPAGTYVLTQSMLYSLDSTGDSAYFRFTINGGSTWTEISKEPKDTTDLAPESFSKVLVHPGGVFDIEIQSRKEALGDVLTIYDINLFVERKV